MCSAKMFRPSVPVGIIGVTTDFLFPVHQQRELAAGLQMPGREVEFEFSNGRTFEANRGNRHPYDQD